MNKYNSLQEKFWSGKFGSSYTLRNQNPDKKNTILKDIIKNKLKITSVIEIGSNTGLNLDVIKSYYKKIKTVGIEINKDAYAILKTKHFAINASALDLKVKNNYDLVISSGFLIHQNPKTLNKIYKTIYRLSNKYIYLREYFNPEPVMIKYRNNKNVLFKRDFAVELWKLFPNLKLVDYGFHWKHDPKYKKK